MDQSFPLFLFLLSSFPSFFSLSLSSIKGNEKGGKWEWKMEFLIFSFIFPLSLFPLFLFFLSYLKKMKRKGEEKEMTHLSLQCICRGKRKDNGDWIEGYFISNPFANESSKAFIGYYSEKSSEIELYEVYPKSVGRIVLVPNQAREALFEGDIVNGKIHSYYLERFVVAYDESSSSFVITNGKSKHNIPMNFEYKILGNVFDYFEEKKGKNERTI